MKKLLLFFLSIIIVTSSLKGQGISRSKFITDSLDLYVNRALTNWRIPGAAVCIVKDGKVVMMKAYGVKELGLNNKVDINTLFMIGSNTKAFTATALAMLQANNKLSLDDKVNKYLPEFKLDNQYASQEAIIRDLLCHRIGFKTFQGDFTFYNTNLTRSEVIEKMSHVKASYAFRTKWGYTNSAFLTAGQIIPKVTGKPWEIYLKENIFAPLGMINTLALSADMPK
jgi:CubicO group peptidase (beta-lactamase class C family)